MSESQMRILSQIICEIDKCILDPKLLWSCVARIENLFHVGEFKEVLFVEGWYRVFQPLEEAAGVYSDQQNDLPKVEVCKDLNIMREFIILNIRI